MSFDCISSFEPKFKSFYAEGVSTIQSKQPASSQLDRSQRNYCCHISFTLSVPRSPHSSTSQLGLKSSQSLPSYELKSDNLFSKVTLRDKENGIVLVVETSIEHKVETSGFRGTESIPSLLLIHMVP